MGTALDVARVESTNPTLHKQITQSEIQDINNQRLVCKTGLVKVVLESEYGLARVNTSSPLSARKKALPHYSYHSHVDQKQKPYNPFNSYTEDRVKARSSGKVGLDTESGRHDERTQNILAYKDQSMKVLIINSMASPGK